MGFKTVYQSLMDVFPQVDSRLLKAVAIEHPKDADEAVEVVLSEILPYFRSRTAVSSVPAVSRPTSDLRSSHENPRPTVLSSEKVERKETTSDALGSSSGVKSITGEHSDGSNLTIFHDAGSAFLEETTNQPATNDARIDAVQLLGNIESEELILFRNPQSQEEQVQNALNMAEKDMLKALMHEDNISEFCAGTQSENPIPIVEYQDCSPKFGDDKTAEVIQSSSVMDNIRNVDSPMTDDLVIDGKSPQEESCLNGTASDVENSVDQKTPDLVESSLAFEHSSSPTNDRENTLSNHQSKIEFLEEIIEAAKDNKQTLFSAMDSVMTMMRQVEIAEEEAEQAKEEAARGGLDTLVKLEELKDILARAKEANNMHAGEIHGEKAILATEAKELQARLISLSDERDNALATIDEMRKALEARLAAAEAMRREAEQEKQQKEKSAKDAFAELEVIMEKVVQEADALQLEAEENSKLREFLMDRGRVVDVLQGEISVICQDVRLLKVKFDDRVPLSQSISSSQTSCILASSGSSTKSLKSISAAELGEMPNTQKQTSPASSGVLSPPDFQSPAVTSPADAQSPKNETLVKRVVIDNNSKELSSDDGWDFIEDE